MGTHMKTTVEIAEALLRAARRRAAERGTTLRAVIEEGLRRIVADEPAARPFRLRDASVKGRGLQRGVRAGDWATIRGLAYEGRGG